jgi:hypothetical protein
LRFFFNTVGVAVVVDVDVIVNVIVDVIGLFFGCGSAGLCLWSEWSSDHNKCTTLRS